MTTLFDIALEVANRIEPTRRLSASSIVDGGTVNGTHVTKITAESPGVQNDEYINGTLLLVDASKYMKVISHTGSIWLVPYDATILSYDTSEFVVCVEPYQKLIATINTALFEIGYYLKETTIPVVSGQAEYTLAANIGNIRKVEEITSDAAKVKHRWAEVGGKLRFAYGYEPSGDTLRLTYRGNHALVDSADDFISPYIDRNWLVSRAVIRVLNDLLRTTNNKSLYEPQVQRETVAELRTPSSDMPVVRLARW